MDIKDATMTQLRSYQVNTSELIVRLFMACIGIEILLVITDYVFNYMDVFNDLSFRRIWNVARENSIPTWFASIQAQLLGLTVIFIGLTEKTNISYKTYVAWISIGLFFIFIGIDDYASIHEKLGGVLKRIAEGSADSVTDVEHSIVVNTLLQNPSFSWHTFIAPFFIICGLAITYFIWNRFRALSLFRYIFIGFGCWIVSQSLDFIEGLNDIDTFYEAVQDYFNISEYYLVTHTFKVIEEYLEMLGTTFLWIGFLKYLAHGVNGLQLRFMQ